MRWKKITQKCQNAVLGHKPRSARETPDHWLGNPVVGTVIGGCRDVLITEYFFLARKRSSIEFYLALNLTEQILRHYKSPIFRILHAISTN